MPPLTQNDSGDELFEPVNVVAPEVQRSVAMYSHCIPSTVNIDVEQSHMPFPSALVEHVDPCWQRISPLGQISILYVSSTFEIELNVEVSLNKESRASVD